MEAILMPVVILGITGVFMGCFLAYASKKFEVQKDPKIEAIMAILPGVNCGGCGYPGCAGYAAGVVEDGAKTTLCAPGGPKVIAAIADIMGVAAPVEEKKKLVYTPIFDAAFLKKNARMLGVYKEAVANKDEEKMAKLEAAAEKTKNWNLELAYADLKAGKELKEVNREEVERAIYKKNARMVTTFADALKAGDQEKVDKLYAAAEKTAKGDLINFYERIKAGEDLSYLGQAAEAKEEKAEVKEEVKKEEKVEAKTEEKTETKDEVKEEVKEEAVKVEIKETEKA